MSGLPRNQQLRPRLALERGFGAQGVGVVVKATHGCLHVLYSPAGGKAWALVSQDGIVIALLGSANPEQKRALFAADNR
jgi:hypothetical protein